MKTVKLSLVAVAMTAMLTGVSAGQTPSVQLTVSTGSSVKQGFTGSRDIVLTATNGAQPAGVEVTLNWSASMQNVSVVAASASTSASKTLACNSILANGDGSFSQTCEVSGINSNIIGNGPIMTVSFTAQKGAQSASLAPTTTIKPCNVSLNPGCTPVTSPTPTVADISANLVAASGVAGVIPFVSPADLNSDGVVDAKDVTIAQQQSLGQAQCGSADINGDGVCDVLDVMLVIRAAQGL